MFSGIIECVGKIERIENQGSNRIFFISSTIASELKIDQSVSHDGVCLTVESIENGIHHATAIEETLKKTTLSQLEKGAWINLERCIVMNGRLDGHIVQGHVDTTATCISVKTLNGSWEYTFEFDKQFAVLVIEKGSIAVNGISLTVFNVAENNFTVAIIPYTYEHTSIKTLQEGTTVNIEFDVIGKYVQRSITIKNITS